MVVLGIETESHGLISKRVLPIFSDNKARSNMVEYGDSNLMLTHGNGC